MTKHTVNCRSAHRFFKKALENGPRDALLAYVIGVCMPYAVVYCYDKQDYEDDFDYCRGDDCHIVALSFLRCDRDGNAG